MQPKHSDALTQALAKSLFGTSRDADGDEL